MVANVQSSSFLNSIVEEQLFDFSRLDEDGGIEREENKGLYWGGIIWLHKILGVFYSAVYFYYMPFFIVFWPFIMH